MNLLLLLAFSISLMISPDNLARLGNLFGWNFNFAMVLIIVSAGIYFLLVPVVAAIPHSAFKESPSVRPKFLLIAAEPLFSVLVKVSAMVFIAAGLTVSSGFAFNEIFIYWFPNFAFAFVLLFSLALLQWLPERFIIGSQVFFSITALSGMGILILKGLTNPGLQPLVPFVIPGTWSVPDVSKIVFFFLFLFIGFDLGSRIHNDRYHKDSKEKTGPAPVLRPLWGIVILISAVYILWGVVVINHVNPARLAQSSISHLIAARTIWPVTGRYLMGCIVILGSCAAVNGLYFVARKEIEAFTTRYFSARSSSIIAGIVVTGCAVITALLLAFGLAGYPALEVLISGSLLLWLLWYLFRLILALVWERKPILIFIKCCAGVALAVSILGLFVSSEDTSLLSAFLVIFLIFFLALSVMTGKLHKTL